MKQYQIIVGETETPLFTFLNNDVKSSDIESAVDMIGEELAADVAEIEVSCDDDSIRDLPYATKIQIFGQAGLLHKFYLKEIERIKINTYKLKATSAIGIIANDTYYGDSFSGSTETIEKVLREIIGTNGLQPYEGYYRGYTPDSTANTYTQPIGVIRTSTGATKACVSATMQSRMIASFTIKSSRTASIYSGFKPTYRNVLFGCVASTSETDATCLAHQYGLYMTVAYNDATSTWQEYGEVFFVYGTTTYSLGTPAANTTYEIDINPPEGKATINGVEYAITASDSDLLIPLHVWLGGVIVVYVSGAENIDGNINLNYIRCEYGDYKLYSESGELQCDAVIVRDNYRNVSCVYDLANDIDGSYSTGLVGLSYDPPGELIEADESTHPAFHTKTEIEKEILDHYVIDDSIKGLLVVGWIKPCTKREALQQLLFAHGIVIKRTANCDLLFTALSKTSEHTIEDENIYIGGSVEYHEHVNAVELTEHDYQHVSSDDKETVYENNNSNAGLYVAVFSKSPSRRSSLSSDSIKISCASCNAALVSGTGTLTARPYRQRESILKRIFSDNPLGKIISVKDATLVTMHNSENVLDRLEAYYGSANVIKESIVLDSETCGNRYAAKTPYLENKEVFLKRKTETLSGIIKADCEFVCDYDPPAVGEEYSKYVILTGSGTWTVPEEVFDKENPRIRVILIGGGTGGDGGYAGEDGQVPEGAVAVQPAAGGAAGDNGNGGIILDVTIDDPAAEYQYSCGAGGAGGDISTSTEANNPGVDGGNTTFSDGETTYRSENGERRETGITNFLTGKIYGRKLSSYVSKGGDGGYYEMDGNVPQYKPPGGNTGTAFDWTATYGGHWGNYYAPGGSLIATGGAGGGGAYGENGGDGTDATSGRAGSGGAGGNSVTTPQKLSDLYSDYYGCGGLGGCGGGGGGAAGPYVPNRSSAGTGGQGGYGGHGGEGSDGCVLIFY